MIDHHELVEFVADAFGRNNGQPTVHRAHCLDKFGHWLQVIASDKSRRAKHAQRIVAKADLGCERRAKGLCCEIDSPTKWIDQRWRIAGELKSHGVHREVTA